MRARAAAGAGRRGGGGHPGDLDGNHVGEPAKPRVQLVGEGEARRAGVVVDHQGDGQARRDVLEEAEYLVVGERLVRHRRQQDSGRPRALGVLGRFQHVPGAQGPDSDDHRDSVGVLHRDTGGAGPLGGLEVPEFALWYQQNDWEVQRTDRAGSTERPRGTAD